MATTATPASTPAQKAATTRKKNAVKRSTTAKKAAATRRENAAAEQTGRVKQEIRTPIKRAGEMAPKVVLVPVGAALIAREELASTIGDLRAHYSTRRKTENELHRFESRGSSAVKKLERDLRSAIKGIETRTEPVTKPVELVAARVENAVVSGRSTAAKLQERIASLA